MERSLDDVLASVANRENSTAFHSAVSTQSYAHVSTKFMIICPYFSSNSRNNPLFLSFFPRSVMGETELERRDLAATYRVYIDVNASLVVVITRLITPRGKVDEEEERRQKEPRGATRRRLRGFAFLFFPPIFLSSPLPANLVRSPLKAPSLRVLFPIPSSSACLNTVSKDI